MKYEHFGITLIEMMAAGLIIVTHNSAGAKDDILVYDEETNCKPGFLVETEEEYVNQIEEILVKYHEIRNQIVNSSVKRAEKFLGENEEEKEQKELNLDIPLKVEKDYIDLATRSSAKINDTGKGARFTLEFLKSSIEELLITLDENSMEDFIKTLKIISTKKSKEKGGKVGNKKKEKEEPKKEIKVPSKSDKFEERRGLYKQYGDGDIQGPPDENDYNDDGDFM